MLELFAEILGESLSLSPEIITEVIAIGGTTVAVLLTVLTIEIVTKFIFKLFRVWERRS